MQLPSGLGLEAAGVVEALGEGVRGFKTGDRVAYGTGPIGAYAEAGNLPAKKVSRLPKSIGDEQAAAMMLKGMTARYLLLRHLPGEAGRNHSRARRCGRGRHAALPMGASPRCDGHRHGRIAREGRSGEGPWLPPRHRLPERRRPAGERDDRRQGRARGL